MIIVDANPVVPLRGYVLYLDDVPELVKWVGDDARINWWHADGRRVERSSAQQLARPEVAGFEVLGQSGRVVIARKGARRFEAPQSHIENWDAQATVGLLSVFARERWAFPWRGYRCRFVPRDRSEGINRRRWVFMASLAVGGFVLAAAGFVLGRA